MTINFSGYKENAVSFYADSTVRAGMPVKMKESGTVTKALAGDDFIGVALNVRGGLAAVQTDGYAELSKTGADAVSAGFAKLAADGNGGVKALADGREYLVVTTDADTVGIIL